MVSNEDEVRDGICVGSAGDGGGQVPLQARDWAVEWAVPAALAVLVAPAFALLEWGGGLGASLAVAALWLFGWGVPRCIGDVSA